MRVMFAIAVFSNRNLQGIMATRLSASPYGDRWGQNGDRMGTATHAAPYRCPRVVPCMAGAWPMFPQTGPSIWESKFAVVGRCGSLWVAWGHEPQHTFSSHKKERRQVAATGHLPRNLPTAIRWCSGVLGAGAAWLWAMPATMTTRKDTV